MVIEKPCRVFCCYAQEDQAFLYDLKKILMPLQHEGSIIINADIDISAGRDRRQVINHHLENADIILLLISADFLASDYSVDEEMRQAIKRHEQGTARVVPIIIRSADWRRTPLGKLEPLPQDAKPVVKWQDKDDAFLSITEGIRVIIQELTTNTSVNLKKWDPWEPAIKGDTSPGNSQEKHDTNTSKYHFGGTVNAGVVGDNANIHHINNIYGEQKDGIRSLKKGSQALINGDYASAKKELRVAVNEIDSENQRREASQAHYLLALALLDGKLPRSQGSTVIEAIEKAMNNAIRLYPSCASYYRIFACIERDIFEHNGLSYRLNEVYELENRVASLHRTVDDEDNERYFRHCQPNLRF